MNERAYTEFRRDPVGYYALRVIKLFARLSVRDARRRLRAAKFRGMFWIKSKLNRGS